MNDVLNKIYDYSLEYIMGERFGRYSKTIIQDRALPDVRDGLKPVQRRILYSMYQSRNTYDKAYRKSAKTVGDVIGTLHPHGDSSIYDAMVRMSQWWKQNTILIDMHGNNGSIDGDSPAAFRYTEARLSKISNELLKDINKDTVDTKFNYDDTLYEPIVLPSKFPNLLVNGSSGISAGYATNIPPHNLGEIIDATIKRIDSPNCYLDTILEIVKGPDFPTGGIACGKQGIIDAFKTGKGRIVLKSKYKIVKSKGKEQIVITEIPFDVNKSLLVKKIDEIRIDKRIDGILEVRDESDLENPETIVIDVKKEADKDLIINYLLKNTDLQIYYNYNMVAIVNKRPMTLGILDILDAYINHQKEVVLRRTKFDLDHALLRMHIVEGLVRAISIMDEVIACIRASKDRADAEVNLVEKFKFTIEQSKAILDLKLYRLTNMDIKDLIDEKKNLELIIKGLEAILSDENNLKNVMKEELRAIKKEYATSRKTEINDDILEIKIDITETIPKENCIVLVTNDGYVKRVSKRSYNKDEETILKDGDYIIGIYELNTLDTLILFTDLGNYLYLPVYELPDLKWKELGKHISNIIKINENENIIYCIPVTSFENDNLVTIFTKNGMIKRSYLKDFKVLRYSKPMTAIKLKDDDLVISISEENGNEIFISTNNGYGLRYDIKEVPITGVKASGVKAIALKNDFTISGHIVNNEEFLTVITSKNTGKRVRLTEFEKTSRARKGILIIRDVKTNPYKIIKTFITSNKVILCIKNKNGFNNVKITELPITDRHSVGSTISKNSIDDIFILKNVIERENEEIKEETPLNKEEILSKVDEKIMTIDDFLDDFNIE